MSGAILNLVRLNTADTTDPEHDYTAGELFQRHEEIKLVNPDGDPCATPMPAKFRNLDYPYRLITGSMSAQGRVITRDITIGVDFLDNEVCRQLERWMQQRARVLFSPNFGRNTVLSYRPVPINWNSIPGDPDVSSISAYDLTGNYQMRHEGYEWPIMWDEQQRRFVKHTYWTDGEIASYGLAKFHHTKGGAGIGYPKVCRNLMQVPYPESATSGFAPGTIGWLASGTHSSDFSFTYNATGFGHADCPASVTVEYSDIVATSRGLIVPAFAATPGGTGTAMLTVWLRGQLPDNSNLKILSAGGETEVDLSGRRFDGWTPVTIGRYDSDWSTCILLLNVNSADGVAGSFELGPTMFTQTSGHRHAVGPYWHDEVANSTMGGMKTNGAFTFPGQGSMALSFMLPEGHGTAGWEQPIYGLVGNTNFSIYAGINSSGREYLNIKELGSSSYQVFLDSMGLAFRPGEINTVAYTWDGTAQRLYVNGKLLVEINRVSYNISFGAPTVLTLGSEYGGFGIYPGLLLTARVDEGAYTAAEVLNLHYALTDPVALQSAVNARGRVYQIKSIPQTLRNSAGGSHVLGNIVLEQVDYQEWQADPLNNEEIIR